MSLINEALKRARVEAARRDAAEKGVPAAALPMYVPKRRTPWLAPILGFGVGLAVVAVAAGAYWVVQRAAPETVVAEKGVPVASPTPEIPAAAPDEQAVVTPPQPARVAEVPAAAQAADKVARRPAPAPAAAPPRIEAPVPAASSAPPPPPAVAPAQAAPKRPVAEEPPAPRPAASASAVEIWEEGGTYAVQTQPPGGKNVKLDFIVWSEAPFAQINGELINPGLKIDGYFLLAVERDRVHLEGPAGSFWLRVK